jgi:hypothetical protein
MPKRQPQPADLADKICTAVRDLTARRQSRIFAASGSWSEAAVQTARTAAERCRLAIEGDPPHSVSLIYGRQP